jgi:hypothetical protein
VAKRRVAIVFEETTDEKVRTETSGQGFTVFIEGAERTKTLPQEAWSASEFWGMKCFAIVAQVLQDSGAVHTQIKKGGS